MGCIWLATLGVAACGDDPGGAGGPGAGGGAGSAPDVVRPQATEVLSAQVSQVTLPPELQGDSALRLAVTTDGTLVGGGAHGLYRLGDAPAQLSDRPVRGLAATKDGILVATDQTLLRWSGTEAPAPSPLARLLGTGQPLALATRGDEVWIGASDALHQVGGSSTLRFADLASVSRIATFAGATDLVLGGPAALRVLRQTMTMFQTNQLDDEVPMLDAVPAPGGRLLGLSGGALLERVAVTGGGAWRPVALDKDGPGATGVEALAVDPVTGSVWVVHAMGVARIEGTRVATLARPMGLGKVTAALATTDGSLHLYDGTKVVRVATDTSGTGPVGYASHIAPFYEANCKRCHVPLGRAHSLDGIDAWKTEVDNIIVQLEAGNMPDDKMPLSSGGPGLVRRWKQGGLLP